MRERRSVRACARRVYVSSECAIAPALAPGGAWKRDEREVVKDTGQHGRAPRLVRLPRGISKVAERLNLAA